MRLQSLRVFLAVLSISTFALGQDRVDPKNMHERMTAVVPIIGAGTYADPKRPMLAPEPQEKASAFLSYSWEPSDDGRYAIVEFVALDRKAFAAILSDSRTLKSFIKGRDKGADIEKELKVFRKDFALGKRERR
jgi:hypothetical protein